MDKDILKFNFELAHVGINEPDAEEAKKTAELLTRLFGFKQRETSGSIFSNEQFEIMKMPFLGRLGHIAIRTSYIEEAKKYLEEQGVEFDESTAKYDEAGKLRIIYFKEDIAGFRFHLTARN